MPARGLHDRKIVQMQAGVPYFRCQSGQGIHVDVTSYFLSSDLVQLAFGKLFHVPSVANEVVTSKFSLLRVLKS